MKPLFFALLLLAGTAFAQEDQLLAILKSDAPLKAKADACQELARVGTGQAVPVLATLLAHEQLSHRARSALEPIADPSVDAVLRQALGQLQGNLLVGVIHSLGVRRDPQAVEPLATLLTGTDTAVAQAAARALGRIGGAAVPVLEGALSRGSAAAQLAVCEGLLRSAETLPDPEAAAVYDRLQALPNLPHHLRVAALSGAIRSRGTQGVPLLVEAIRTGSPVPAADAIRMSMDLPGAAVTQALVGVLAEANEEKQILLLQTLGERGDATAAPGLIALAQSGSSSRRLAAIQSLVRLREASSIKVLAALVKDPEPMVAGAALTGLTGLPGKEADAAVVALTSGSDSKTRIAAIGAVGQRRITAAVPELLKAAGDAEAGVAGAGFQVLAELAGLAEIRGMVDAMLKTQAVPAAESALLAVCARQADKTLCTDPLLPGLAKARGEPKLSLLRVLASVGGPKALIAVRAAATDPDPSVQETALRALCDWPTVEALADLARLAKADGDPKFKLLARRGQIRLIPLQTVADAEKVSQLQQLLPSLERPEERRLALAALGTLPCAESLALIEPYLTGEGLREEAGVAAVAVAEKIVAGHPAEVAAAMAWVRTKDEQLAGRVRQVLAQVPAGATEAGFIPIFNGNDLTGWDGMPGWWKVEEGALTAESTPDKPCNEPNYLIWRGGQPADFELLADFRLSGAGNSGIQLRSQALPNWDTSGYQADMSGDGALVGFVYEHTRGLIAGRGERVTIGADGKREARELGDAAELLKIYQKEGWNTYRIICRGPEITLFINGTLMCQFTDRDAKQAASKGIIALQMHPGPPMKIEFKNLRLKTL
ncbi:MAG: family 16 glycoside hydrolase [Limisphaerales bacterium]